MCTDGPKEKLSDGEEEEEKNKSGKEHKEVKKCDASTGKTGDSFFTPRINFRSSVFFNMLVETKSSLDPALSTL